MAAHELDLVPAVEQALARKGLDFEVISEAVAAHLLGLEVDGDLALWRLRGKVEQVADLPRRERDRQQADLEAVGTEDVREARGDHCAETRVLDRPGGVLARRAASEVGSGHEDAGAAVLGPVEHETTGGT